MTSRNLLVLIFILTAAAASFGLEPPRFSRNPGIYVENTVNVSITHTDNSVEIWYTTNGSEPRSNNSGGSRRFSAAEPIPIFNRADDPNYFSEIRTTPCNPGSASCPSNSNLPATSCPGEEDYCVLSWQTPSGKVSKGTVIRAAAFKGGEKSETIIGSFFGFSENSRYRSLPIVSVIVDSLDFFGREAGIYVPGNKFTGSPTTGNYYQRGDEWERPGHIEYFDLGVKNDGPIISQTVGYRIHGAWTRRFPQKTLRVYARKGRYESSDHLDFKHKVFHNRDDMSYRRMLLRGAGNDFERGFMRDAWAQYMVSHAKTIDMQAFRSVIVFLNGEFWGVHHMRERLDKHYLNRFYGVNPENLDILDFNNQNRSVVRIEASEGDADAYNRMVDFAKRENLANRAALDSIFNLMDIDSYVDHYAIQMLLGNWDGIYNNHSMWRERRPYNKSAPVGRDGRFRWFVYDLDHIFTPSDWPNQPHEFSAIFERGRPGNDLFVNLMDNESVRYHFINSFANLLNTAFHPGRAERVIDSIAGTMVPVMGEQIRRWGYPSSWYDSDSTYWLEQVTTLKSRYASRINEYRNRMRDSGTLRGSLSSLGDDRTVTVRSDTTNGFVKINSMLVDPKMPGQSSQFSWSGHNFSWNGVYFANVPVTVIPIGKTDYRFEKWVVRENRDGQDVQSESTDSVMTVRLSSSAPGSGPTCSQQCNIQAFFEYDPEYFIVSAADRVSRKAANLSIGHRVHSRSNVTFNFTLPEAANVQLRVYNLAGKEVARVANNKFGAGSHQLNWKAGNMASGVYIYRLKVNNRTLDSRLRL